MDDVVLAARAIRRVVLQQSRRANVGHIGSALSVADALAVLYCRILRLPSPTDPERDRFILSKGHAALALYGALSVRGWLAESELDTFCADGSRLGVHPDRALPGVDLTTGSLGLGLSFGAGAALAARLQGSGRRVFVLLSDAECNEGSVWEAVMFAAHHRLSNLVALVDDNGQQAMGKTRDILDLSPLAPRWRQFGWDARDVDGHSCSKIETAITQGESLSAPRVIILKTVFGRGVSFMEGQLRWHYLPMSAEEYRRACEEIEAAP
jgi:transketolase